MNSNPWLLAFDGHMLAFDGHIYAIFDVSL